MQKDNKAAKHAEIALAIKGAKKKLFANSRAGMELREAFDGFCLDAMNRFQAIAPPHVVENVRNSAHGIPATSREETEPVAEASQAEVDQAWKERSLAWEKRDAFISDL